MALLLLLISLLVFPVPVSAGDEIVAYRAGTILTVSGPTYSPGIMLVQSGKILEIGKEVDIPEGAEVVDLSKFTLMPGLVHAGLSEGIAGFSNEESSEITPAFRVTNAIAPESPIFKRLKQLGVTTVQIEPGNRNVIGGLASVYKTEGAVLVRKDVSLKAVMGNSPSAGNYAPRYSTPSFYNRRPTTRMGVVWEFRKAFIDARKAPDDIHFLESRKWDGTKVLVQALERTLPVRIYASRSYDLETSLRLAEEFGLQIQLEGAEEAYAHADTLAKQDIAVALRPQFRTGEMLLGNDGDRRLDTFARLSNAGVRVALLPGGSDPSSSLISMAAFSVRCGAVREKALRAITLVPAEMLGVGGRVGSLEPGKDADFLVLNGDPLGVTTRVEAVFIEGRRVAGKSLNK